MAEIHAMPEHAMPELDGGLRIMSLDEAKAKRKSKGLCPTCGEVRTHKPGIWKAMMPEVRLRGVLILVDLAWMNL